MGTINEAKKSLDDALKLETVMLNNLLIEGMTLDEINVEAFLKDAEKIAFSPQRDSVIIRASIIGILANIFLTVFKAIIGLMSHSIAIVLDAVNNLSDAASSLITIVGTKLSAKAPDKKHPFGHGRVEYLTAMTIAVLILYAGIGSLRESLNKIITPDVPEYGTDQKNYARRIQESSGHPDSDQYICRQYRGQSCRTYEKCGCEDC